MTIKWNEHLIAGALARQVFNRAATVVVPRCGWTGYECDLLVVEKRLRLIDVEVKISRADIAADRKKDKWWQAQFPRDWEMVDGQLQPIKRERGWPPKVWKHYYAFPAKLWKDDIPSLLPNENSGILLLSENARKPYGIDIAVQRYAKINREAKPISSEAALDIARLCTLRMWDMAAKIGK